MPWLVNVDSVKYTGYNSGCSCVSPSYTMLSFGSYFLKCFAVGKLRNTIALYIKTNDDFNIC